MTQQLDERVRSQLSSGAFAFIDAGCASGGSIDHCARRFGRRPGLGLDWYGGDLDVARAHGHAVAACDVVAVDLPTACVEFSSMMDFLEHLPNEATARRVVEKLAAASRDFLFIRHPSFDDIDYLAQFGLKLTWTDWSGHTNMMRIDDFRRMFDALGWHDYLIYPDMPVADSSHGAIVPASAPIDTIEYDPAVHGPKPMVTFDHVVYGKYDIFVRLSRTLKDEDWRRIATTEGWRPIWVSTQASTSTIDDAGTSASAGSDSVRSGGSERLEPLMGDTKLAALRELIGKSRPSQPVCSESWPRLGRIFDPWLSRNGQTLPPIPAHLEQYLDRHVLECLNLKRFFFLRLAHLTDAIGRLPEPVIDVLSVGAGVAYQEAFLAGRFAAMRVTASDVELPTIRFPMPNLQFVRLDLLEAPGVQQYDLVFSIECLEHIKDYRAAFRHKARLVKPGGYLYMSVPFASKAEQRDPELQRMAWTLCEHYTPGFAFEDLDDLFAENELDVLHAANMFHLDVVLPVREIVDRISEQELERVSAEVAQLLLLDLTDRRADSCREAEGIRFLGRKRGETRVGRPG